MDKLLVACVQQRLTVAASHEEFETQIRRFMRLAQAKSAHVVVFPELAGLGLAPPLFSGVKLGFMKQVSQGRQPGAGAMQRGVKRVAEAAADALGGYRGSLNGLLKKRSDSLWEAYADTFGRLAREFGMVIAAGSLYVRDPQTDEVRHRACLFDVDGELLGWQDKLNLAPDEQDLAHPGTDLAPISTRFGRLGLLIGWDILYPELARALAAQGAEVLIGLVASPGTAQAQTLRSALAMRVEENQLFAAASFLLGPNFLGRANREDYFGQAALLAPISLTDRGSGVLVQMGTNRTEGLIAAELDHMALHHLWETGNFRPRQQMVLGSAGRVLAELYEQATTLDQAVARLAPPPAVEEPGEPVVVEPVVVAPAVPLEPTPPPPATPTPEPGQAEFRPIPVPPDETDTGAG